MGVFSGGSIISSLAQGKGIFDNSTYTDALSGPYKIVIKPNMSRVLNAKADIEESVTGILKNQVEFSVAADWDTLGIDSMIGDLVANNKIIKNIQGVGSFAMKAGGASLTNTGLVTRKFYKKGGYLEITPEFRILDWNSDGVTKQAAMALMSMALPRKNQSSSIEKIFGGVYNSGKKILKKSSIFNVIEGFVSKAMDSALRSDTQIISVTAKTAKRGATELTQGQVNLTEAPVPVTVIIGNWFQHTDMVITNVSVNFSQEMTRSGPLYVDLSVQLSSREAMVLTEDGINNLTIKSNEVNRVVASEITDNYFGR